MQLQPEEYTTVVIILANRVKKAVYKSKKTSNQPTDELFRTYVQISTNHDYSEYVVKNIT